MRGRQWADLIQTKGTQRLAKLFNNRFDDSANGISAARPGWPSPCGLQQFIT